MQKYTLRTNAVNLIVKPLEEYSIGDCLDLVRDLATLEDAELKREEVKYVISDLEARMKKLLFG